MKKILLIKWKKREKKNNLLKKRAKKSSEWWDGNPSLLKCPPNNEVGKGVSRSQNKRCFSFHLEHPHLEGKTLIFQHLDHNDCNLAPAHLFLVETRNQHHLHIKINHYYSRLQRSPKIQRNIYV